MKLQPLGWFYVSRFLRYLSVNTFLWDYFVGRVTMTLLLERQVENRILNFIHLHCTGAEAEIFEIDPSKTGQIKPKHVYR